MDNTGERADIYVKKAKRNIFSGCKQLMCSTGSCCNISVPKALRIHAVLGFSRYRVVL